MPTKKFETATHGGHHPKERTACSEEHPSFHTSQDLDEAEPLGCVEWGMGWVPEGQPQMWWTVWAMRL